MQFFDVNLIKIIFLIFLFLCFRRVVFGDLGDNWPNRRVFNKPNFLKLTPIYYFIKNNSSILHDKPQENHLFNPKKHFFNFISTRKN